MKKVIFRRVQIAALAQKRVAWRHGDKRKETSWEGRVSEDAL